MTEQQPDRARRRTRARTVSRRDVLKMAFLRVPERAEAGPSESTSPPRTASLPPAVVRPPGAARPVEFVDRCTACGDCVEACSFDAIRTDASGLPFLEPAVSPCLSCLDVPCASVCEAGALQPVGHPAAIRMGTAFIDEDRCVAVRGESCTTCFDACPFRHRAIRLQGQPSIPVVSPTLCTGCGVCAHLCPEDAIAIRPPGGRSWIGGTA